MKARTLARIVHTLGSLKTSSTRSARSRRNSFAKLARFGSISAVVALVTQALFIAASSPETIATYASDCSTPKTTFLLGDAVCAVASDAPLGPPAQRRFEWVAPDGSVFQLGAFITADPQSASITIPSTGPVGIWQVKTVDRSNNGYSVAKFFVQDPQNAAVDLWCPISAPFEVSPGSSAPFSVFVTNKGPNDASNVSLTVTVATNSTFQSETQVTGPAFNCSNPDVGSTEGSSTCTIETLPAGTTAQLTFVFQVDAGATAGSAVASTAHVESTTAELFATDNTFTASVTISPATCDVTCPGNVTDVPDTGQCGKAVEFPTPSGSGTGCGTIVCSPPGGSVFPIGTTNVVCFGDSGGPCSFTVTIKDPGTTISCPGNMNVSEGSPGIGSAVVTYASPTFPDSCAAPTAACNPPSGSSFPVGTTTVSCLTTNSSNTQLSCSFTVQVNSLVCILLCPDDVFAVENPAGSGHATVSFATPTPNGCPSVTVTCSPASGSVFPVGTTAVNCTAKDGSNVTVANCNLSVTVSNAAPCTLTCPATVAVTEDGNPNPDPGAVVTYTAPTTQNCSGVTVTCSPASGTRFPLGTTGVTCVARDTSDNAVASCGFVVIVNALSGVTLTFNNDPGECGAKVNYTVPANTCSGTLTCTPPQIDPETNMPTFFSVGVTVVNCVNNAASPCSFNFNVAVLNTNPTPAITAPASGALYTVGSTVSFSGSFTDDAGTPHSALWTFVSGSLTASEDGAVTETTGTTGTVTASHTFNTIGVYLVTLSVSDRCGGTGTTNTVSPSALTAMVVIYDPNGGFVTGGGWINSPAGAYVANTSLTGRLSFGINAKYLNNSTIPTGQTEVQLREANFNFHSTGYDWLIITGAKAQYSGSGTVNGAGNYGFLVTVIDGNASGGGGVDKFRIKIWDKNNNNAVVYDNQMGASDNADPTTTLGGGSIVVH